jgi:hypothetical protein
VKDGIVVAGSLAQRPGVGGHTWVLLQYLLGLRRLGWEVLFVDRLEPEMCVDADGHPAPVESSENLRYLIDVMNAFGLADSFSLLFDSGRVTFGLDRQTVLQRARRAAVLLNVMGFLDDEELLRACSLRAFLDIDPGFPQMWSELGLADPFDGHDVFVTVGQRVGAPDCAIPTCEREWLPTRPPVVLEHWPVRHHRRDVFTSVGVWRGPYAPVQYRGSTYGLRVHEFRRFATLPVRCPAPFEAALEIHPDERPDLQMLSENNWSLVDPAAVVADPFAYREYIGGSKAELMIAKGMYVHTRSGWFSDRSACYLASGKPVVAQDTGLAELIPSGSGLLTFDTLEQAVASVERINRDYASHARAARRLAEEHFDSDRVLGGLLEQLGVN